MKFLLTSGGISNDSIRNALVDLLGKPIAESSALCIPTAVYACPGGAAMAWRFIRGVATVPCANWGGSRWECWSSPRCPVSTHEHWVPLVQETDALLVYGGDVLYLCYWMRQSGLADLLPELSARDGLRGGERREYGGDPQLRGYDDFRRSSEYLPAGSDRALGLVDFSLFPHLDHPERPDNSMANAERWAAGMPMPTYAIDDQTAIKVVDGEVSVISEGHWKLFTQE